MIGACIIHRHGARLPSRSSPGDNSFPIIDSFWEKYGMTLLPSGVIQLEKTGRMLAIRYPHLVDNVKACTTDTSRTIMSCLSVLEGLVPTKPKFLSSNGDTFRHRQLPKGSVEVAVEESRTTDTFFQVGTSVGTQNEWIRDNIRKSATLRRTSEREDVVCLFDKLFVMSANETMSPMVDNIDRLEKITSYFTLVRCSNANYGSLLSNNYGITLTESERQLIEELSNQVYAHSFCSHDEKTRIGMDCVGQLLSTVCMTFSLFSKGKKAPGISVYSCHDTTLLATASALGIDGLRCPGFGAYFLLELSAKDEVTIYYSSEGDEEDMELVSHLRLDEFRSATDSNTLENIREMLVGNKSPYPSHSTQDIDRVYSYYDVDGDGVLSREEFHLMCKRLEVSGDTLFFDRLYSSFGNAVRHDSFARLFA